MKNKNIIETKKRIAIVGLGTLGCETSSLLIENAHKFNLEITLIDRDVVEEKNLGRQKLYSKLDVGKPKAVAAFEKLSNQTKNKNIKLDLLIEDLNYETAGILEGYDFIVDCTDNLEVRFLINDYCKKNKVDWAHAAAAGCAGTVCVFLNSEKNNENNACFSCLMNGKEPGNTCETEGILPQTAQKVAQIQFDCLRDILEGKIPNKKLIRITYNDLKGIIGNQNYTIEEFDLKKRGGCKTCLGKYDFLDGKRAIKTAKLCGRGLYQILPCKKLTKEKFIKIKESASKLHKIIDFKYCFTFEGVTIFSDGRALIRADDEKKAKIIYSKYIEN